MALGDSQQTVDPALLDAGRSAHALVGPHGDESDLQAPDGASRSGAIAGPCATAAARPHASEDAKRDPGGWTLDAPC